MFIPLFGCTLQPFPLEAKGKTGLRRKINETGWGAWGLVSAQAQTAWVFPT